MRLSILCESKYSKIFVDFDETLARVDDKSKLSPPPDLEVFPIKLNDTEASVIMRHGWQDFLHQLRAMPNDGIYIYSAGYGSPVFPQIQAQVPGLEFVKIAQRSDIENVHPHSILIDDDRSPIITDLKLGQLFQDESNKRSLHLIKVSPFMGMEVDDGLKAAMLKTKEVIAGLEDMFRIG